MVFAAPNVGEPSPELSAIGGERHRALAGVARARLWEECGGRGGTIVLLSLFAFVVDYLCQGKVGLGLLPTAPS